MYYLRPKLNQLLECKSNYFILTKFIEKDTKLVLLDTSDIFS